MRLRVTILLAVYPLFAACAASGNKPAGDFDEFRCRISGHWDNVVQASEDAKTEPDESRRHPRRAMSYIPVANENIEGQLFAILNYGEEGFEGELNRVSLHRFRPVETGEIVHEFMFLLGPRSPDDLKQDLVVLTQLGEKDLRINHACAMRWSRRGKFYAGSTSKGRCVTSSFTESPIVVEGHGELYADRLVRHDQNFSLSGESLPIPGGQSPEVFDRTVRPAYPDAKMYQSIELVRSTVCD